MRRISSVVKNEKEMLCTVDGIDWEIFMVSGYFVLDLRTPNSFEARQLDLCGTSARFQIFNGKS